MSIKFSGKKIGALLLVIIVLVFAYFLYDNYYDNSTHTVYITYTGEKYHRSTCQYLHSSKISITLENAVKQGYDGCSRCNPPRLKTKRTQKAIIRRPLYEGGIFMLVFAPGCRRQIALGQFQLPNIFLYILPHAVSAFRLLLN